jgi:hypothetical protein
MKMFFVLISCLALTSVAYAQGPQGSPPAKKKGQSVQTSQQGTGPGGHAVAAPAGGAQKHAYTPTGHQGVGRSLYQSKPTTATKSLGAPDTLPAGKRIGGPGDRGANKRSMSTAGGTATTSTRGAKSFTARHFNLQTKSTPTTAPRITYRAGNRIQGSQQWTGSNYTVFRTYTPQWHDQNWWRSHHSRIVFVFGGWYFWNSNYWYPAWGYDPSAYYFYDGPIYAYNDLPPDQVIANVQASLQAQGYYQGEVDGILGPLTRAAIANYQRDQGLYITSAIDEPTLAALGMV